MAMYLISSGHISFCLLKYQLKIVVIQNLNELRPFDSRQLNALVSLSSSTQRNVYLLVSNSLKIVTSNRRYLNFNWTNFLLQLPQCISINITHSICQLSARSSLQSKGLLIQPAFFLVYLNNIFSTAKVDAKLFTCLAQRLMHNHAPKQDFRPHFIGNLLVLRISGVGCAL